MADCSCFRNCNCLSCLKIYETRCDPLKRLKRSNRDLHRLLRDLDYLCDSGPQLRKRIFIVEEKVSSEESCSCCSESCSSCEESDQTSDEDCDSFKCLKANDTSVEDSVYTKIETDKLIDKYKSSTEQAKDELNEIWSTLTNNIENYLTINKSIEMTKDFEEKNRKYEEATEVIVKEETPVEEKIADIIIPADDILKKETATENISTEEAKDGNNTDDKQLPTEKEVEFYLNQIHLFYANKNAKSSEMLSRLARIKTELNALHEFLQSDDNVGLQV